MRPPPTISRCPLAKVHFAVTVAMATVIWFVQLVTYPQFDGIGAEAFVAYHAEYSMRIGRIVAPLMLLELACAAALVPSPGGRLGALLVPIAGLLLVLALWAVTALVQVPLHARLADCYDKDTVADLVAGNWTRTILWTLRIPLAWKLLAPCR